MARYRKIDPRIWNDEHFRILSDSAKLVFLFLLTHPHLTSLGAMRATPVGLASELGWSEKEFRKAFAELFRKPFLRVDEKSSFLSIPNFLKYNQPENPNVVKSWGTAIDNIPECNLKCELIQNVKAFVIPFGKAFEEVLPKAFREPFRKGLANQEQEQEQEQEQKIHMSVCELNLPCNGQHEECTKQFTEFWNAYPRHDPPRKQTRLKWCAQFKQGLDCKAMLAWIEEAKKRWIEKKYIPQPTTWINQRRWEGDLPPDQRSFISRNGKPCHHDLTGMDDDSKAEHYQNCSHMHPRSEPEQPIYDFDHTK